MWITFLFNFTGSLWPLRISRYIAKILLSKAKKGSRCESLFDLAIIFLYLWVTETSWVCDVTGTLKGLIFYQILVINLRVRSPISNHELHFFGICGSLDVMNFWCHCDHQVSHFWLCNVRSAISNYNLCFFGICGSAWRHGDHRVSHFRSITKWIVRSAISNYELCFFFWIFVNPCNAMSLWRRCGHFRKLLRQILFSCFFC